MKNHVIYLVTDTNRIHIEAGYSSDIFHKSSDIHQAGQSFANASKLNRIVYKEEFSTFEEAQRRHIELSQYTRMMKERIIRKQNPNWLNIHIGMHIPSSVIQLGLQR